MPEEGDAGEHQPIEKERVIDWRIKAGLAIGVVIALVAAAVVLSGALNPRPGDANLPPRAMFTAEPLLAKVGQVVRFNGSASADADGKIANYSWNFSDGSSTSGVEVEHSFAGTGAYDVTLTVKDDKGATDSATAEIKVVPADNLAPTARIKASAASVGVGIPVVFDGSYSNDSDGIIKTYAWDFGDGGISNESRVAHAFKSKGSYLVSLLVEDDRGAPDSDQVAVNVTVPNLPPVAVLGTNRTNATVMSPVLFDSSNSSDPDGTIAGQDWDLGDGNRSTAKQLSHAYERPGNYTVRLAVRDDMGATANASVQVVVFLPPANSPPVAKPQADRSSAKVGEKFSFNGSASFDTDGTVVSHQWDFGDGTSATGALAEHAYASPGLFTVLLTVTDDKGAKGSDSLAVSVGTSSTKQSATFRAYPPVAFVGENVTFDACESGDLANATELRWDHGDGTRQNVTAPVCVAKHSYSAKGQMNVSLEIAYLGGNLSRANRTVGIYVPLGGGASSVYSDAFYPAGDTLDPASEYSAYATALLPNVYETLVGYDGPRADALVPVLATAVPSLANGGISANGTEYAFVIRSGVGFHSGNPLRASDVEFSLRRVVTMGDTAGPSWMLERITTAYVAQYVGRAVTNWVNDTDGWGSPPSPRLVQYLGKQPGDTISELDVWNLSGAAFRATSNYTLRITLDIPYSGFLAILAFSVGSILEEAKVRTLCGFPIRVGQTCSALTYQADAGTGPFKIAPGDWCCGMFRLTKNPGWWMVAQRGMIIHYSNVFWNTSANVSTRAANLKSGLVDSASVTYQYSSLVEGDPAIRVTKGLPTFTQNIGIMNQNIRDLNGTSVPAGFFADLRVRQAMAYELDYGAVAANCSYGGAMPGPGPIPEGSFGYKDVGALRPTYDPARAEQLFRDSGWWDAGFWLRTEFNTGNTARECIGNIVKSRLEALNPKFHVNVTGYAWPTYLQRMFGGQMSLFWLGWAPDYADPDNWVGAFMRSTGVYPKAASYRNATLDQLIDDAARELDPDVRAWMYQKIQEAGFYDQPMLWHSQALSLRAERSWVQGWYFNPMLGTMYADTLKGT